MTTRTLRIAFAVLAFASTARADSAAKTKPAAKGEAVSINANEVKWGEAPADLPKGALVGVLHGDPSKAGPFTLRLKMPDGYKIPPHWHTQDEDLTVLSGTLAMYMGDSMSSEAHDLGAAGYHFLPGKAHHAAEARGETVVQIHGKGPFDIHYLNPTDNPNPKSARK